MGTRGGTRTYAHPECRQCLRCTQHHDAALFLTACTEQCLQPRRPASPPRKRQPRPLRQAIPGPPCVLATDQAARQCPWQPHRSARPACPGQNPAWRAARPACPGQNPAWRAARPVCPEQNPAWRAARPVCPRQNPDWHKTAWPQAAAAQCCGGHCPAATNAWAAADPAASLRPVAVSAGHPPDCQRRRRPSGAA